MKLTYTFLFGLLAFAAAQSDDGEYEDDLEEPYTGGPGAGPYNPQQPRPYQPYPYQPRPGQQGPPPGYQQGPPPPGYQQGPPPPGYQQGPPPPGYQQGPPPPGYQQGPPPSGWQQGPPPPPSPFSQDQSPFQPRPSPPGPPRPPYQQGPPPPQQFQPGPPPPQGGQGGYSRACGYDCVQNVIRNAGCSRPTSDPGSEFQQAARQCFCTARGIQEAINGCGKQACQQEGRGRSTADVVNQFNQMCNGVAGYFPLSA